MHVDSVELNSREKPFDPTAEFSLLTNLTYKTRNLTDLRS